MRSALALSAAALLLAACSSDSPVTPTPPGPAARIQAVSAPDNVVAGTTAGDSVVARVLDASGRGVPGVTVTWTSLGAAVLLPGEVITDEKGYARTTFHSTGRATDVQLQASALTTTGPQEAAFSVKVVPAAAAQLVGVPAGALKLGLYAQRQLAVAAMDAYGNPVPVAFSASNPAVLAVTSTGLLNAKAAGTASVNVIAGALQVAIPVTVGTAILSDGFDGENGGAAFLSYRDFANWTVSRGDVDLIGANSPWDFAPGHGLYVDLDGYYAGGLFLSRDAFNLPAGSYTLGFKLAGSQRGDVNTVTVSVGQAFSEAFTVASADPFTTITRTITLPQAATVRVSFDQGGNDGYGALLDDVSLTKN